MPTRLDWIQGGQELMRAGGIGAVKLRELAHLLRTTTGSFYHHFESTEEYLGALATQYGEEGARLEQALSGLAPEARIEALLKARQDAEVPALDRAMRVWASYDERAADAVRRVDETVLGVVQGGFRELGFPAPEARTRALTAYAAGVGLALVQAPWPAGRADERRALALFLTRPS